VRAQRLPLRSGPPALGAHSEALLLSLGYGSAEITALRDAGIIGGATEPPCEDDPPESPNPPPC